MPLSKVELIRQIGSFIICDYETGVPLFPIQSVEDFSVEPVKESSKLVVPRGTLETDDEITGWDLKFSAYEVPPDLVQLLTGGVKTTNASNASGEIVDIENVKGSSVYSATTGCTPAIKSSDAANIKPGIITCKAKDANTLTIYHMSDVAFKEGADVSYVDDSCIIVDDVDIATGASTGVTGFGFKIVGGSSATAFTTGDTMRFRIRRQNKAGATIRIGGVGTEFDLVTAFAFSKKNNDVFRALHLFQFRISGITFSMGKEYKKYDISAPLIYDSNKDGYFDFIKE